MWLVVVVAVLLLQLAFRLSNYCLVEHKSLALSEVFDLILAVKLDSMAIDMMVLSLLPVRF